MNLWMLCFLFSPLILGVLIYALDKVLFNRLVFVLQGALTVAYFFLMSKAPYSMVIGGWPNTVGIECVIDTVSLLFMGMTLIGFWYIYLYDWPKHRNDHKYLFLVGALQSVLLSLFMVYDLFTFFILIELMTIIASILITYKKDSNSVKAGIYYLLINSMGMVLYIIGIMILYSLTGSLNIHVVLTQLPLVAGNKLFKLAMAFIISSVAVKSAFFPLFQWLPVAHSAAPGSVSAILSGLIVKSGIFVFLRLGDIVFSASLNEVLVIIGLLTALFGSILAMVQYDIKRLLSFSTVSHIGLILVGFTLPGAVSNTGGYLHLMNHFLFKSLLFLCAGLIITQTGERNLKRIRGIMMTNPLLSVAMLVGILGITGVPLFNGHLSKLLIKSAGDNAVIQMILYIVNVATIASFIKLSKVFTGPPMKTLVEPGRRQWSAYFIAILTLLALPIELVYLKTFDGYAYFYYTDKLLLSSLELGVQCVVAYLFYTYILVPLSKRNHPYLKRIKSFGFSYFGESSALLLAFLVFMHIFITAI